MTVGGPGIRRAELVRRHNVRLRRIEPEAPLQVGNGSFGFTVDVTGLQTFPERYPAAPRGTLLGTNAAWAWHSMPGPTHTLDETHRSYETARGPVPYPDLASDRHDGPDQTAAETWLRANPHRLDLGRVGLWLADPFAADDPTGVDQELDLWTGTVRSRFVAAGAELRIETAAHPTRDLVGVRAVTGADVRCGVRLRFPYGSAAWGDAAEWGRPEAHRSVVAGARGAWTVRRTLDGHHHEVRVAGTDGAGAPLELIVLGEHDLVVRGRGGFDLTIEWAEAPRGAPIRSSAPVVAASAARWSRFWETGAAVELAGSDDPRAPELERRIVLSRYLTALNSSGSVLPTETGLMTSSWWGRSHLEMHWFHAAHFALWGHADVVERQLAWYERIAPRARATARRQRLGGARWPKQVDPTGRETPSSIGPFLVWQQPQPIQLAELVRRAAAASSADAGLVVVERWLDLVAETAETMASLAVEGPDGFGLGPPIVPAQESYHPTRRTARNPTFELAQWASALGVAIRWCEWAGRPVPERWRAVAGGMARPHRLVERGAGAPGRGGEIYAALATEPYLVRDDHPSMLAAYGVVPPTPVIDPAVMSRTFDAVWSDWDWSSTWGWDYPVAAMCATRLGRPAAAVDALLMDTPKNRHLVNGHNRQTAELPIYLPGNGALLAAVALMAAGWDGAEAPTPGFGPGWHVTHESLHPLP
ncbi:MAG: hypothetical protein S0880_06855 [Actinomycetota bacterium]|nr:hypothetical protein [Actinomycetota bacterium]